MASATAVSVQKKAKELLAQAGAITGPSSEGIFARLKNKLIADESLILPNQEDRTAYSLDKHSCVRSDRNYAFTALFELSRELRCLCNIAHESREESRILLAFSRMQQLFSEIDSLDKSSQTWQLVRKPAEGSLASFLLQSRLDTNSVSRVNNFMADLLPLGDDLFVQKEDNAGWAIRHRAAVDTSKCSDSKIESAAVGKVSVWGGRLYNKYGIAPKFSPSPVLYVNYDLAEGEAIYANYISINIRLSGEHVRVTEDGLWPHVEKMLLENGDDIAKYSHMKNWCLSFSLYNENDTSFMLNKSATARDASAGSCSVFAISVPAN